MSQSIWNQLQGIEFKQTFYNAGGVRTRALEAGSGDKALILMHGTGGHAEAYMRNLAAHAEHFHVYAIDFVGHGYSEAPDLDYGMQCYVDHLLDFLDAIGVEKAYLSGESMGASVAFWFADQHPDRVEKIVLNTGLPLSPPEGSDGAKSLGDLLERSRAATGDVTIDMIEKRMQWLVHDAERDLTDEIIQTRFQIYSQPGRAAIIRKATEMSLGTLLDPAAKDSWYNPERLGTIECPVLVLWTEHNPGQPVEMAQGATGHFKNAEFVVLDDCAHWPQWEQTEAFNKAHLEFLLK